MPDYKFKEITEKIIGASMKVHSALGNGLKEVIYQRALALEMQEMEMKFERELEMPVYYKGRQVGERRVIFLLKRRL